MFVCLFVTSICLAQITIKGKVYQVNEPLEGVAVYLNNTMLGATTNTDGEFSIPVKEGQYDLIISYLGFKKINYALNTTEYNKPLIFNLEETYDLLDEITIKKVIYDEDWQYNLTAFKQDFIGITELSEKCILLNPHVLYFDFNTNKNILTAYAKKPLQLKHKGLGYLITYELESFVRNKNTVTYLGYSRYQELKGGKRKQKKWKKNRLKAFNGSVIHFYKAVLNNSFTEDGFIVNQFKRVLNPERPTDTVIKKAKELVRLSSTKINFYTDIKRPKSALDSAMVVLKKIQLPKFIDYLYKSKLSKDDIITFKNEAFYLSFKDNLSIVYTKEKEELRYITRNAFSKKREPLPQTSSLIPLEKNIFLDRNGILINPLATFYEGYWSYEKFGNSLPLDYITDSNF
ncbi:carboxypeptidase-like regulatory domain-containing protein [Polaribacter sp. IC063]|uniref:carboxypeptidase-like regulatory domain-containing protein n=1 Tax=Polaribacter sp. IC063 TaxID=57031 RepID=UPI0016758C0E|nr:carboxypeptidase-like regulatory domain-containing protein [Polaribacter sp. IC063]